jgi:hypothetical protein
VIDLCYSDLVSAREICVEQRELKIIAECRFIYGTLCGGISRCFCKALA